MPLYLFLTLAFLWTLIPALTLISPPLDVVEMLAWGQHWELGYYKHPPLPAWLADVAYRIVGNHVWGVYALSQLCMLITFLYVFRLGKLILGQKDRALYATLFLLGVYYYSYPTPEFNHNVIQMPIWAAFSFYAARIYVLKQNEWLMLGLMAGLAMYAKYSSVLIILSFIVVYFYGPRQAFITKLKNPWMYVAIGIALLVFFPHLLWLIEHDFQSLVYAADRVGDDASFITKRVLNPLEFMFSQLVNILPALIVVGYAYKKPLTMMREKSERHFFLSIMCFGPFVISVFLAVIGGIKLLPMWGMTYWNLLGIWVFYRVASDIDVKRYIVGLVGVIIIMLTIFGIYYGFGFSERRAFPSNEVAQKIQRIWKAKTDKPLELIIADEWLAGSLALALPGRPRAFLRNDINKAPWVKEGEAAEKGAVVLWRDYKPGGYPEKLEELEILKIGKYDIYMGFIFPTSPAEGEVKKVSLTHTWEKFEHTA